MTKKVSLNLLQDGKAFCMVPWVHLHVPTSGPVMPCTEAVESDFGSIDESGLEGIWNGETMRAFRLGLMADEKDARCRKCYDMEASDGDSMRRRVNKQFAHHLERVRMTTAEGRLDAVPVSWDLRLSNLCNFRCRMCWHGSSSRWFEDGKALGHTAGTLPIIRSVAEPKRFLEQLFAHLSQVEAVYFAGGEPLMMEEQYVILETLLAHKLNDIALAYTTNLSKLSLNGKSILELWKQFTNVRVQASADGIGGRGELIRKGLDWDVFMANLELVKRECPHINLGCRVTVSAFNVLHLADLHRTLVEQIGIPPHEIRIYALQDPSYYSVSVLTDELKSAARTSLRRHHGWIETWYATNRAADAPGLGKALSELGAIDAFLRRPADGVDQEKLREMTCRLDALRGESTPSIFPELKPIWDRQEPSRGRLGQSESAE